jgi:antitoxin VapB
MTTTRLFKNGNSQAVRIPAELAFPTSDMELVIERVGEELRIRPAQRRMGNVMKVLSSFSPNFMSEDRGNQEQTEREAL